MKFTPKEDFRHGTALYEAGNTYDSAKHGLSDADVLYFRQNGWAEVEGQEAAPERSTTARVLAPDSAVHAQSAQEA